MKSYEDLGLNSQLQALDGLSATNVPTPYNADSQLDPTLGGINYTHVASKGREYKAVVALSKTSGAFDNLQAAINHVNELGGGKVLVTSGTYTISSDITLFSHITLEGEDKDTTLVDFNSGTNVMEAVGTSASEMMTDIHLKNLQFANSHGTEFGAVRFDFVEDSSVEGCEFTNNWNTTDSDGRDVYIYRSNRIKVNRCRSLSSGHFIYSYPDVGTQNEFNIISENYGSTGYASFFTGKAPRNIITGNVIDDYSGTVFDIVQYSSFGMINQNTVNRFRTGAVHLGTVSSMIISSNSMISGAVGTQTDTILVHGAYNLILGNQVETTGNANAGIRLGTSAFENASYNVVDGNYINGGANTDGINIQGTNCSKNIVTSNVSRSSGTSITDNGTDTALDNNTS